MIDLLRAELLKQRSTRTALGVLAAAVAASVAPVVFFVALAPPDAFADGGGGTLFGIASSLVPYVLVVFGVLGMTNEYRHGTITYTYLATPRRGRVMVAKLAVYAGVGALAMAFSLLLVVITGVVGLEVRGVDSSAMLDLAFADVARQMGVAGLMTAFGVALGALFRAQVATVAGVLIWALAIETVIALVRPMVGTWLPFVVFSQVTEGRLGGAQSDLGLDRPEAFAVSVLYIGVISVAAVLISMSRDVT